MTTVSRRTAYEFLHRHVHSVNRFVFLFFLLLLLVYNGSSVFYLPVPFFPANPPAVITPANFSIDSAIAGGKVLSGKKPPPVMGMAMATATASDRVITRFQHPVGGRVVRQGRKVHLEAKLPLPAMAVAAERVVTRFQDQVGLTVVRQSRKGRSAKEMVARKIRSFEQSPRPGSGTRTFSTRIRDFFGSDCKPRFFMTVISSGGAGAVNSFGERESFAVESIFKSHKNACLVIVSNSLDTKSGKRILKRFADRKFRVAVVNPDFAAVFKDTPAESWFKELKKGNVRPGEVSLGQNLSNLLRLALLYKFGGIYVDTDVVVLRSFAGLRNSIGAQTVDSESGKWSRLNNAVLVFDRKHPLIFKFIEEFTRTFNGNKWGHNGPYMVSRVVSRVSAARGVNRLDFSVLPPSAFYPVDWSRIHGLFRGPRDRVHSKWIREKVGQIKKESYAVHLWNRQSRDVKIEDGSVISRLLEDCCCNLCSNSSSSSSLRLGRKKK